MRLRRKRMRIRAWRKHFKLQPIADRTANIRPDDILLFSTLRNENIRLPYFLKYYRAMGISHFLMVDNNSSDGGAEYLAEQPDVSLWSTKASYKKAGFGIDWLNWLQGTYGHDHWTLVVDPDELFIYPFCDSRPIQALTDWLDATKVRSFGAMLLDMYPRGGFDTLPYQRGQDPIEIAKWFDSGNYSIKKNKLLGNLWIQGGPRARVFFHDKPKQAPALNKIPLVKWHRNYTYVSSTHTLLPRGLNLVYGEWGGERASGILLHTKFLDMFCAKADEELSRKQHYSGSMEYKAYAENGHDHSGLWCKCSEKYINWRQLELLGLMSKGNWV
ncbi:FIG00992653: hypothetical protein [hydrothermal vent metagenome]|uniref:Glycosyl transferase family 2 n=1 Tax=hydrothermal vent metagenome TaxID=652676 RepID=A0A3B0R698_9ZZZZ